MSACHEVLSDWLMYLTTLHNMISDQHINFVEVYTMDIQARFAFKCFNSSKKE